MAWNPFKIFSSSDPDAIYAMEGDSGIRKIARIRALVLHQVIIRGFSTTSECRIRSEDADINELPYSPNLDWHKD